MRILMARYFGDDCPQETSDRSSKERDQRVWVPVVLVKFQSSSMHSPAWASCYRTASGSDRMLPLTSKDFPVRYRRGSELSLEPVATARGSVTSASLAAIVRSQAPGPNCFTTFVGSIDSSLRMMPENNFDSQSEITDFKISKG